MPLILDTQAGSDLLPPEIAVIGLACRFPGGASNPTKFYDLLAQRKSAYSDVPPSRWNPNAFHHAGGKLGTLSSRGAHFLTEDVTAFDAPFFNITANEAKAMDPTARLLLEVTYEALENAGIPMGNLAGSDTSCYVGCFTRDFHEMLMRDVESAPLYSGTGTGFSLLSNRISWFYDFRGPSLTLDTACSSSLVGLHIACQGLRSRESKVAVVAGANLILSPDLAIFLSNLHMLSKDGLSRSFADNTTGYGRGEGITTLILKPLSDALRDGDPIRAVIRGTGVNQDGHTTGITVPNSNAQADLIRQTYNLAGLDMADTTYFEAHGTGTAVGDPLELGAVARTFGVKRRNGEKLFVGSVKSNIGHLEGAAGLAGVVKCILMLESGSILPNIHFETPNRRIPFDDWNICVPTSVQKWPADRLKRASANSFGYGGTNSSVILDDGAEYLSRHGLRCADSSRPFPDDVAQHPRLFIFSARDESALARMRELYSDHLESFKAPKDEDVYLETLSFTLSERRSRFDWKGFVVASTLQDLRANLSSSRFQFARTPTKCRMAWVFTGQGAQWARMGLELMQNPVFRDSVNSGEQYLKELGCSWSVTEELAREEKDSNIQFAKLSQPVCTILQVALVDLLQSWNIRPAGVVGHSSGEIGAAYTYGAISREQAWAISYYRGKLCSEMSLKAPHLKGSMMAAGLSREAAQAYLTSITQGKLVVACVNSPQSVTISGDENAIDELQMKLKEDAVFCRKLKVENAYHSHHMELIAEKYLQLLSDIRTKPMQPKANVIMASSVTGKIIKHTDLGSTYWVQNLVSPVLFSDAVQALIRGDTTQRKRRAHATETNFDIFLEVGPHAALKGPLRQILQQQNIEKFTYRSVIMRGENAMNTAVECAANLYLHGVPTSITAVNNIQKKHQPLVSLPPYPWNHSLKYWAESRVSKNYRFRDYGRHDLLGSRARDSDEYEPTWRNFLRVNETPWLRHHQVSNSILYPGSGIMAMPIEAIRQLADKDKPIESIHIRDARIEKAIVVPDDQNGTEVFLRIRKQRTAAGSWTGWWEFSVFSCVEDRDPEENGSGLITIQYRKPNSESWSAKKSLARESLDKEYQASKEICQVAIDSKDFYEATEKVGLNYGSTFQGLTEIAIGKNRCCCTIAIPDTKATMPGSIESPHLIHPTTLDVIFHSLFAALGDNQLSFKNPAVPVAIDSLTLSADQPSGAGAEFRGFAEAKREGSREIVANVYMFGAGCDGPKVQVKGLRCLELPGGDSSESTKNSIKAPCGTLLWKPDIDLCDRESLKKYLKTSPPVQGPIRKSSLVASTGVRRGSLVGYNNMRRASIGGFDRMASVIEFTSGGGLVNSTCKVIDLIAHQNPDLSILQIGGRGYELTASILATLGAPDESPRLSRLVIADTDPDNLAALETSFSVWKPKLSSVPLGEDLNFENEQFQEISFDAIIVTIDFDISAQDGGSLSKIQKLLKSGGKILVCTSAESLPRIRWGETSSPSETTDDSQFTEIAVTEPFASERLYIASKPNTEETEELPGTVYLLQPPGASNMATDVSNAIIRQLNGANIDARIVNWPPNPEKLKDMSLISLLELEKSMLLDISEEDFLLLRRLALQSSSLLWVSVGDDPVMGAAMGYLRVLKNENPNLQLCFLLTEKKPGRSPDDLASLIADIRIRPNKERELAEIDGYLSISRWIRDDGLSRSVAKEKLINQPEIMTLGETRTGLELITGDVDQSGAFYFVENSTTASDLAADEIEIEVKAIVIRPDDAKPSHAHSSRSSAKEFSGIVKAIGKQCSQLKLRDQIYGCGIGPYGTLFRTKESLCRRIPENVAFEDAVSWPITFGMAIRCLFDIARLRKGQSILIQGAATAVGQAILQLAVASGSVVFAAVGKEQQSRIVEKYGIPEGFIINDDDTEFADTLMTLSQQKGFDVIINISKDAEAVRQMWHCVAPFGVLINIEDGTPKEDPALDMAPFRKGCRFSVVNVDTILQTDHSLMTDTLQDLSQWLSKKSVQPLSPLTIFSAENGLDAFRYAQAQGDIGRVIVTFSPHDRIPISPAARTPLRLDANATYILAGGLGGLGRSLARLLVTHGARHLVFISRSGAKSDSAKALLEELSSLGAVAKAYPCDMGDAASMEKVIAECSASLPPIRGVIQSAAVLNDAVYDLMTHKQWQNAIRPKIHGSWLLHQLLPRDLDFFVMLSSISGVIGNKSQANYAAGNTYQDALAHYRRKQGLPAVSVDLGLMLDIGLIAERGGFTTIRKSEAVGLEEVDFHAIMKAAMVGSYGSSVTPAQLVTGLPTGGILRQKGVDEPYYFSDPRFSLLKKMDLDKVSSSSSSDDGDAAASDTLKTLAADLRQCKSLHEAAGLVSKAMCVMLADGLSTEPESIDSGKPLHQYGVDSLLAVEIRGWIIQHLKADVTLFDVLSGASIGVLAEKIARISKLVSRDLE